MNSKIWDTYIEVWNSGEYDKLDAVISQDLRRDVPATANQSTRSLDGLKEVMKSFHTAFPDTKVTLDEIYFLDDRSFSRFTFSGTNTGPGDTPPTGKRVEVSGMAFARYADGKLVEEHVVYDVLDFMAQLGAIEI